MGLARWKKSFRFIGKLIVACLILGMLPPCEAASPEFVRLQARGVVPASYGDIEPGTPISRGEFLRMCVLAGNYGGLVAEKGRLPSPFRDVGDKDPLRGFYNLAYENGLVAGYADRTLRPQQSVSRKEAAILLLRLRHNLLPFAAGPSGDYSFADSNLMTFSIRETARQAVVLGYLRPDGGSVFAPSRPVTYGEAMVIFQSFIQGTRGLYDFDGSVRTIYRDGQFAEISDGLSGTTVGIGMTGTTIVQDEKGNQRESAFKQGDRVRGMLDDSGFLTLVEIVDGE